uniref:Uncharacterized protein n=1 Tax=Arundo donax TaxID=35708 RepID=A0A0A9EMQ4_ARUDO
MHSCEETPYTTLMQVPLEICHTRTVYPGSTKLCTVISLECPINI